MKKFIKFAVLTIIVAIAALVGLTLTIPKESSLTVDKIKTSNMTEYPHSELLARAWFNEAVGNDKIVIN